MPTRKQEVVREPKTKKVSTKKTLDNGKTVTTVTTITEEVIESSESSDSSQSSQESSSLTSDSSSSESSLTESSATEEAPVITSEVIEQAIETGSRDELAEIIRQLQEQSETSSASPVEETVVTEEISSSDTPTTEDVSLIQSGTEEQVTEEVVTEQAEKAPVSAFDELAAKYLGETASESVSSVQEPTEVTSTEVAEETLTPIQQYVQQRQNEGFTTESLVSPKEETVESTTLEAVSSDSSSDDLARIVEELSQVKQVVVHTSERQSATETRVSSTEQDLEKIIAELTGVKHEVVAAANQQKQLTEIVTGTSEVALSTRDDLSQIILELSEIKTEVVNTAANQGQLERALVNTNQNLVESSQDLGKTIGAVVEVRQDLDNAKKDQSELHRKITTIHTSTEEFGEEFSEVNKGIADSRSELQRTRTELAIAQAELNKALSIIYSAKSEVSNYNQELENLKSLYKSLEERVRQAEACCSSSAVYARVFEEGEYTAIVTVKGVLQVPANDPRAFFAISHGISSPEVAIEFYKEILELRGLPYDDSTEPEVSRWFNSGYAYIMESTDLKNQKKLLGFNHDALPELFIEAQDQYKESFDEQLTDLKIVYVGSNVAPLWFTGNPFRRH